jgi:2-dehydropantoate 2-reductase
MMKKIETIAVIGAGALGGMYAAAFADLDSESVFLVAGGRRKQRLESEGFWFNDRPYRLPVAEPQGPPRPVGLILVAVKHRQLEQTLEDMARFVGPESLILSVMNGIESEERIATRFGWDKTLYCVALGMDSLRENNRIRCSNRGRLLIGESNNSASAETVQRVKSLLEKAGIDCEVPEDIVRTLWWKYMINIGINQCSAVTGANFGVFQQHAEARELMDAAMREVMAVAQARDIDLNESDIRQWHQVLMTLGPEGKTSMLQDIDAGRATEVGMFAGSLVAMGKELGVETPVNHTLLRIIRVMEKNPR